MYRTAGFTLIELMITLAVASVLLAVAVPSFQSMIESNALASQINLFVGALNGARSEAVKRGKQVTLCKSTDLTTCTTGNTSIGYEAGWIVFVDQDNNGTRQTTDEELLKASGAMNQTYTLRESNNFINRISFEPNGGITNAGTFVLCKEKILAKSRALIVIRTGRMRLGPDADHDGIPEGDDGTEITSCAA